jgi:IS1 family transposase
MNVLPFETQTRIVASLVEGNSIRATERLTDVHRDTVMRLGVKIGEACGNLHRARMRNLQVALLEFDEQWDFIGKKRRNVKEGDAAEMGDVWFFTALASTQKAIISYVVGKRTAENTNAMVADVRARVVNRPQITADGFPAYPDAIDTAFNRDVDFAVIEKHYQAPVANDAAHRYSPSTIRSMEKTRMRGNPKMELASTSYVERFNLTTRMQVRRCTRLTNGFSKKLENHAAALALYVAHYNFCRWHESIRCTPAMALGITDHIWTIGELIENALAAAESLPPNAPTTPVGPTGPKAPRPTAPRAPVGRPLQLRVIQGGKVSGRPNRS